METPSTPVAQPFTGNSIFPSQAAMRQTTVVRDQHGRAWEVNVDSHPKAKMTWCSPPMPRGWSAPLDAQPWVRPVKGEFGRCRIDYEAWEQSVKDAHADYEAERRALLTKRFPGQALAHALEHTPPDVLKMLGRAPASLHFVRAAKAGNPWILGLKKPDGMPYDVPTWAKPIVHEIAPTTVTRAVQDEEDATFYAQDEEMSADAAADLEDAYDPDAVGGQRQPVRRGGRQRAA